MTRLRQMTAHSEPASVVDFFCQREFFSAASGTWLSHGWITSQCALSDTGKYAADDSYCTR